MDRQDRFFRIQFVLLFCAVLLPNGVLADGGHGVGITFLATTDTSGAESIDFRAYQNWSDLRIRNVQ